MKEDKYPDMVFSIEIIRELSTLVFFDHESVRETKLSWKYVFSEMSSMFHLLSGSKLGVSRRRVRLTLDGGVNTVQDVC